MIATIQKGFLSGKIPAISSKSYAHRLLIAAALADRPTTVRCATVSEDILTASRVLKAMGASVERTDDGFIVEPVSTQPRTAANQGRSSDSFCPLPARSGSTRASPGTEGCPSGLSSRSTRNSATTASNSRRRAYFRSKPKDASRRATTPSRPTFRRSSSAACSSRCRSCRARAR